MRRGGGGGGGGRVVGGGSNMWIGHVFWLFSLNYNIAVDYLTKPSKQKSFRTHTVTEDKQLVNLFTFRTGIIIQNRNY